LNIKAKVIFEPLRQEKAAFSSRRQTTMMMMMMMMNERGRYSQYRYNDK